jgi:KDO2-lipid IV(A) lauroyltransferase
MSHHYLALRGIPVHVVTRDLSNRHLNRTLSRIRSRHGARVIPKHGALRTLSRALRDGHTVGLLADQNCPSRERFFPFFGVPASTYTHHAKLFVKRGCRVIFIACIREGTRGPFRVTVRDLSSGLPERAHWTARERHQHQADELIRRYLRVTEEIIRENPQQYLWMHRRWKSRPTGEPWLYHDLGQPLPAKIRQASATAASE